MLNLRIHALLRKLSQKRTLRIFQEFMPLQARVNYKYYHMQYQTHMKCTWHISKALWFIKDVKPL